MAFAVDLKLYQVWQNGILTVKDISNYGANGNSNKDDFLSRTIYLVRANSLEEEVIDFPFLNPLDEIQESIDIEMKFDQAISMRLEVVPIIPDLEPEDVYFIETTAAMTGYIDKDRIAALSELDPSRGVGNAKKLSEHFSVVSAFRRAALVRAAQGDIVGSQRLLDFCTDQVKCLC